LFLKRRGAGGEAMRKIFDLFFFWRLFYYTAFVPASQKPDLPLHEESIMRL
jgi:hypothetical protein